MNLLIYLFMKRMIKLITVIIEEYRCYQLHKKLHQIYPLLRVRVTKLLDGIHGSHSGGYDEDCLLRLHSIISRKIKFFEIIGIIM